MVESAHRRVVPSLPPQTIDDQAEDAVIASIASMGVGGVDQPEPGGFYVTDFDVDESILAFSVFARVAVAVHGIA